MFGVRRGVMPRLFSCCLSVSIVFVGEFVAPYRSVDCSDKIVKDFYRLSVMSVDFRSFVNNYLFDERAQYFGREFFKTVILVNKHHKIENFIVVFFRFRAFAISDFNVLTRSFRPACSVSYVSLIFKYRSSEILPSTLSS